MAQISDVKMKKYPDITKHLEHKNERRLELAKLPVETKLKMVARLRDASRDLKSARKTGT